MSYTLDFITQPPIDASDPSVVTVDVITRAAPAIVLDAQGLGPPGPKGDKGDQGDPGAPGGVTSIDGQTGVVDLSGKYVDVAGDTMTGPLTVTSAGVGVAPDANYKFRAEATTTHTSGGNPRTSIFGHVWTPAANATSIIQNFEARTTVTLASGVSHTSGEVRAAAGAVYVNGDGTQTALVSAVLGQIVKGSGSGTIADARAFFAVNPSINSGTLTNAYGLYIAGQKSTNVTNGYGVYQTGTADLNYFAGNVGIGVGGVADQALNISKTFSSGSNVYGVNGSPINGGVGSLYGGHFRPSSGGATTALVVGVLGNATYTGTGTLTTGSALVAASPARTSSGTITTAIGLDIQDQKIAAGVTNGFGVYQRGANDINTFLGPLALGFPSANTGVIRLPNDQAIVARNAGNTADVPMLKVSAAGVVQYWNGTAWTNLGGLPPPNTGWAVTAGYTADKAINPEATTVTELARVVGTLIDALKASGILGS